MDESHKTLRARFAAREPRASTRRADFKGYRHRVNLRVAEAMAEDLALIKLVTGEPKNGFCERVLNEAVEAAIRELRSRHGDEAWRSFQKLAEARKRKGPSG